MRRQYSWNDVSHTVVSLIVILCFPYFLFCHECAFPMRGNAVTSEYHFPNAFSLSLYISLILSFSFSFPSSLFLLSPLSLLSLSIQHPFLSSYPLLHNIPLFFSSLFAIISPFITASIFLSSISIHPFFLL